MSEEMSFDDLVYCPMVFPVSETPFTKCVEASYHRHGNLKLPRLLIFLRLYDLLKLM